MNDSEQKPDSQADQGAPEGQPQTGETKQSDAAGVDPHTLPPHERIDGLRAWLAQVDRKLGVRSYAGLASIVIALAVAIVALVLTLGLRDDSATQADVAELRDQVEAVEEAATEAVEEEIAAITQRLSDIEGRLGDVESEGDQQGREIEALQDDVSDVRDAIADIEALPGPGGPGAQND